MSFGGWTWLILATGTLVFALPGQLLDWQIDASAPFLGAAFLVAYTGARLAWITASRPAMFQLTFWVFSYVWLGLAPLLQMATGVNPLQDHYGVDVLMTTEALVLLGLLTYDVTRWYAKSSGFAARRTRFVTREVNARRLIVAACVATLIALAIVASVGGPGVFFTTRSEAGAAVRGSIHEGQAGSSFRTVLLTAPPLICLLFVLGLLRDRRRRAQPRDALGPRLAVLAVVLIVVNVIANNPFWNPRFWSGTVLIAIAALVIDFRKVRAFRALAAALVFASVLLFPYVDAISGRGGGGERSGPSHQLAQKGDFDAFQMITNSVQYVDAHGIGFGRQLLGPAFFFVPRSVWPGKPRDTSVVIGKERGYINANLSLPVWGEGYVAAGVVGVVLFLVLLGLIGARLDEAWFVASSRASLVGVLVPTFAAYQVLILRGSLLTATGRLVALLLLIVAVTTRGDAAPDDRAERSA